MRKTLTIFLTSAFFGLAILSYALLDSSSSLQVSSSQQVDKADSVPVLLDQVRAIVNDRRSAHTIDVTPAQARSLAGFIQRAHGNAQADSQFKKDTAKLQLSYFLGHIFTDLYLNVEIVVRSAPGVDIQSIRIGSLTLPGNASLAVLEYFTNVYTQTRIASAALEWVKNLDINEQRVKLDLAPSEPLLIELSQVRRSNEDAYTVMLKQQIIYYLDVLDKLPSQSANAGSRSLTYYLSALMSEASTLSQANPNDATMQNEAAMLALAIYAGNYRFARLVGNLGISIDKIPKASQPPVLAGREDLSLHFIYSAGIKLLSEQNVSIAVGEFKELMDRSEGGSGYSFMDLAADLAGAHFAAQAVSPEHALHVQALLSKDASEAIFLPNLDGLDEGLNAKAFANKYQAVDSPAYQEAVQLINARIATLAISSEPQMKNKESE
jgi:hypothetical protein